MLTTQIIRSWKRNKDGWYINPENRHHMKVGDDFKAGDYFTAGDGFRAGNGFTTGDDFTAGDCFTAGNGFTTGDDFTAGDGIKISDRVIILPNTKIPNGMNGLTFQMSWYPCTVCGDKITSGCHTKTVDEWIEFLTEKQAKIEGMQDFVVPYYQAFFRWVKKMQSGEIIIDKSPTHQKRDSKGRFIR